MLYVGNKDNAPRRTIQGPDKRTLFCLLSPSLDPSQKEIACGTSEMPPGVQSTYKSHPEGELFFCISGHGHMLVDGELVDFSTDTALWVPSNVKHQVINDNPYDMLRVFWAILPPFGGDQEIIDAWKEDCAAK